MTSVTPSSAIRVGRTRSSVAHGAPQIGHRERWRLEGMAQNVNGHRAEPENEAGLVGPKQPSRTPVREDRADPCREQRNGGHHDDRTESA